MVVNKKYSFWLPVMAAVILLTGCTQNGAQHEAQNGAQPSPNQTQAQGDIREITAGKDLLPTFLNNVDPKITKIYAAVPDHLSTLEKIACYCGCGESVGHKSNLECFIHDAKSDGSLNWDSHGTTCNVCLNIAAESMMMKDAGKSDSEIRHYIDDKYKEGYAAPTPTPMP